MEETQDATAPHRAAFYIDGFNVVTCEKMVAERAIDVASRGMAGYSLAPAGAPLRMVISEKHAYYYALRTASRSAVVDSFMDKIRQSPGPTPWNGMVLGSITRDAINYARLEWPKYYSDKTHHGFVDSWEALHQKFVHIPSFFDLAIWQRCGMESVLQGLALGKPSDGKTHLTINWVERSFAPTYLRGGILLLVLACAEEYAKLLGCKRVLIKNPVDPSKYARYGYEPYRLRRVAAAYLYKDL